MADPINPDLRACETWTWVDNVPYGNDSPNQLLDLYLPDNGWNQRPPIVWLHPGGWLVGDESAPYIFPGAGYLLQRGFVIASVRYRLSSETRWPAQIVDTLAALRFLEATAAQWGVRPGKRVLWGSSSGAHLTAEAAVAGTDPAFQQGWNLGVPAPVTMGICDCPPTDFRSWVQQPGHTDLQAPDSFVSQLFGFPVLDPTPARRALVDAASPALRVTPTSSPLIVRYGTGDKLVPVQQPTKLINAYKAKGVPVGPISKNADHVDPPSAYYSATDIQQLGDSCAWWLLP